ncbi:calmodulin-like [Tigriopus californicus]|uniref:calmodulin-like n=1 Tax=Tigriopus californicus TaxID=6832 RepID=UPI0027DAA3F3|nr:calmodulin-like [Tigriopus californicus]
MGDILPADLVILYQDAFFHFDTDRDGVICTKQLGPLLRYCGENPSEADIQDMMNEVDSDASNNLIFPAFLTLMAKRYSDSNAEDEIREAFRVFDSDGNGFINRSELRAVMMNLGEKLSEDEIESLIDTVDIDGDGQINYEEFYIMMDPG